MKHDMRTSLREAINDVRNKTHGKRNNSNPHLALRRIRKKLDVLQALTQVVKYGHSAIEQCTTVLSWLDTLTSTIEQPYAERTLQFGNRSRYIGLRGVQTLRRLPHAAGLRHLHEDA